MKTQRLILFVFVCFLACMWMNTASANRENPGSCLLFPYYEINGQSLCVISITNVSSVQDVWVRFVWIDGNNCDPFDRWKLLTARDTFTFTANAMNPFAETGFLYAYAVDTEGSVKEIDADYLIGQEIVIGNWATRLVNFSVNAVSFQCLNCNTDSKLRLDGKEYTLAPKTLYFPRFFGQSEFFQSKIVLINLTGGKHFSALAKILTSNDNEVMFSATEIFDCFEVFDLTDISPVFNNFFLLGTDHDPSEPFGFSSFVETGYFEITGDEAYNPDFTVIFEHASIHGLLIENLGGLGFTYADLPFQIEDPDKYFNGMLWSTNPDGT